MKNIINSILDESFDNVEDAINDYICGLDDCEYYAIDSKVFKAIQDKVINDTFVQKKLF